MTTAAYQWGQLRSVRHAWVPHDGHTVPICGNYAKAPRSLDYGIDCAACVQAVWWYDHTGQADYLRPRDHVRIPHNDLDISVDSVDRRLRRFVQERVERPRKEVIHAEGSRKETEPQKPAEVRREETEIVRSGLQEPASLEAYAALPEDEQRYWAPLMLIRQGQAQEWDQERETAEAFQRRCYEALQRTMMG